MTMNLTRHRRSTTASTSRFDTDATDIGSDRRVQGGTTELVITPSGPLVVANTNARRTSSR